MPSHPMPQRSARSRDLPIITFERGTNEFDLWIEHWRSLGFHVLARDAEKLGYVRVRSAVPPDQGAKR